MAKYSVTNSKGIILFTIEDCDGDVDVSATSTRRISIGDATLEFEGEEVQVEEMVVENFTDTFYVDIEDLGDMIYSSVIEQGGSEDQAEACQSAAYGTSVAVTVEVMVEDGDIDLEDVYLN